MPTIEQIRAARALLDWSQSDLADHAGLSQTGIARIENGTNQPNSRTIEKILNAFESFDIEFIDTSGVRKRRNEIKVLRGIEGLKTFINDLYETAKKTRETSYLYNADPKNFHKWLGKDWWNMHAVRMSEIGKNIQKNLVAEGNDYFVSLAFAEHRAFPSELFNDQSIYAYGSKLAFVTFGETEVEVKILDNHQFAEGFKVLFDIAWEKVAKPI